jgi:hypothetical protein
VVIAVEPGTLRFLLRGRPVRVCAPRSYKPGRYYRAGIQGRRTAERSVKEILRMPRKQSIDRPLRGEPEAVDRKYQAMISRQASERDDLIRRERAHQARIAAKRAHAAARAKR